MENTMSQATEKNSTATNFDLPSLHLLLEEIDVALKDAETHLSEFHDDEEQVDLLMDSANVINQLAAIFELINFKGTSELALAIAANLKKLHASGDNSDTELVMDISEGIMVLDRYVEFVLLKEVLEPALLVPIINKLRAHLNEPALSADELSYGNSISITNPARHYQSPVHMGLDIKPLVSAYRTGLGVVLAKQGSIVDSEEAAKLTAMANACQTIAKASDTLFWQAAAIATKNLANQLPLSNDKKRTLIYLEQQLQQYLPLEDRRFADVVSLACNQDESFAKLARQKYGLGQASADEQKQMQHFLFGPNREITDTLNLLIQNEIATIKEKVDSLVRGMGGMNSMTTAEISEQIHNLGLSMHLLGLDEASDALKKAASSVSAWQNPTPDDFDYLLEELMVAENASIYLTKTHTPGVVKLPLHNRAISLHQLDTAYDMMIKESRINIANINGAIEGYIADPNRDALHLQNTPEMLEQVAGALNFLNLPSSATMLNRLARYLNKAVVDERLVLSDKLLADIADVVVAADYQLEGQEQNRPVSKHALLVGQHSLNRVLVAA